MKKFQQIFLLFAFALMGYSSSLHAEDTDIYVANATNMGRPNVLFVIDTGANFSSSAAVPCTAYASGGAPSLGATAGGIEQCALVDAISGLNDSAVNIGILVNNNNNFATERREPGDAAYHEVCQGTYGGCVIRNLTEMNEAGKTSLINFIKSWKTSGQNSATEFNVKSGGDRTANMMQEAWAYFNGKVGMSGKNYGTSILTSGCQKNVIIFIGNAFNNSGTPGDTGTESPFSGTYGMTAAQTKATEAQKKKITDTITFAPATCGVTFSQATNSASNWSENWGDEWARLMNQQNGGPDADPANRPPPGTQNIDTYTIGVVNDSSCKPDYPALLISMASNGGGQYFKTANSTDVKNALDKILNQVQAVNSVFSSASLPVSVNADGSYLNQIYLGMFRPDAKASPRWLGNLKQYHLIKNSAGKLVQGDALDVPAINPTTGFISPTAVSFWTSKKLTALPDTVGGFWVKAKDSQGIQQSGYDSPDGEVVEKGGVSQQIRLENLQASFGAAAQTSTNPRRMYVYCPGGGTCDGDLTAAANQFSTANTGIASNAFGTDTVVPIASIVRTGTTALVTTVGNHGFSGGVTVTVDGASQPEYNVTQSVTVNSSSTFTITGLPDFPTTPSQGSYTFGSPAAGSFNIVSMSRTTHATGGYNTETVTVTTDVPHGFTTASNIAISGVSPAVYTNPGLLTSASGNTFTFNVPITPTSPAVNVYTMQLTPTVNTAISADLTNPATGQINGTTATAHGLHAGQQVIVTGAASNSKYAGTYTLSSVTATTFTITTAGNSVKSLAREKGTVKPDTGAKTIATLTRDASADPAKATATGLPSNWFGAAAGDTAVVNIAKSSGSANNEAAYLQSGVTATCANAGCTTLTFPVSVSPATAITLDSAKVGPQNVSTAVLAAGKITRNGTTVTVTGPFLNQSGQAVTFTSGQTYTIAATGTALDAEAAYLGDWKISCTICSGSSGSLTLTRPDGSPVQLSPATPATGINMTAYSQGTPPDRNTLIRWIRGEDNFGGENGPGNGVTVRGSVHGDVLHSRPLVINYGDSRGIVVFYGANDGVYRAVNGNQKSGDIGGVPPGGELWGLVLSEHFGQYNRQRQAAPELKFPSTRLAGARPKDYFADGQTAAYQVLTADRTKIDKAYIYVTMRRGGRFLYALDVTDPLKPRVMWKIDSTMSGFSQLGQTWSRPRVTIVQGGGLNSTTPPTPVLIFGAGYDPAEDSEPPGTDTMGRGIFVVNAETGALIWRTSPTCTTSATCRQVPDMTYAIPSDIAFVDRDNNGFTDRLYFGDMGGNVWRADIAGASTADWTVTKLAALGCDTGVCPSGTTPRKFFFPPAVISVKSPGEAGSFDAVSIVSGDREHPLKSANPSSSYFVADKFFMIMDKNTSVGTPTASTPLTRSNLDDATSAVKGTDSFDANYKYDVNGVGNGFYISFALGEKGVNAPLATEGIVFFATNRPIPPSNTCAPNLGEAKAYAVSPFTGSTTTNVFVGGGLPPSPVAGLITIPTGRNNPDGTPETKEEKFCIGCAADCTSGTCSALEQSKPNNAIPRNLKRTYWYKK